MDSSRGRTGTVADEKGTTARENGIKKLPPESDPSSKEVKSDPKGLSPERCGS